MSPRSFLLGLVLCLGIGAGCATTAQQPAPAPAPQRPSLPKQPMLPGPEPQASYDPWQPFNRAMFFFNNDLFDEYLLGPVAHGWTFITPETVRRHLEQAFDNLNAPGYVIQPLLQGDPKQSGVALGRFVINSTVGIAGFFDPAHHYLGLARRPEDFGQTLGVWGIGPGPYLVLPVIWPRSSLRDFLAYPVDVVLNVGDGGIWQFWAPWWAGISVAVPRYVNRRALVDEDIKAGRAAAVDWYIASRDAYLQGRARDVRNGAEPEETPNDDLYEIDDPNSPAR
ncbi:MAG TPA: VacJ family lipoprotein [Myxococcota bacterium]|nr:VacJ family lipoprotein [Myxococcota bacterium]